MPAILNQGKTSIRDALKSLITHVTISDDNAAFSASDTVINPTGGATTAHTEACTEADVDTATFDATITVTGSSEFTGKTIYAIGVAKGSSVTGGGTDLLTRTVRTLGIGVQAGDTFTIGVRVQVQDNS